MKCNNIVYILTSVALITFAAQPLKIWTKKEALPEKHLIIQKTYRGSECIMVEMDDRGKKTRTFKVGGKVVAIEADEDGDGFFESLMVFDPDTGKYELFIKSMNGSIIPLDSEKLEKFNAKKESADSAMYELLQTNMNLKTGSH